MLRNWVWKVLVKSPLILTSVVTVFCASSFSLDYHCKKKEITKKIKEIGWSGDSKYMEIWTKSLSSGRWGGQKLSGHGWQNSSVYTTPVRMGIRISWSSMPEQLVLYFQTRDCLLRGWCRCGVWTKISKTEVLFWPWWRHS